MRIILFTLAFLLLSLYTKCQIVTVTLNASEDAAIGYHDGTNTANLNYGNAIQNAAFWIPATASPGINANRALIKFNLGSIPQGVTIVSASLNLYGMGPYGTLNGHSGPNNACLIERIIQNWNETIVTWSTQPSSTALNSATIANSNSNTQDYLNIPVTGMVMDMYNNNASYGFLLKLQNETLTNSMIFCSLNYTNTSKHPKLIVSYNTCTPLIVSQNKSSICVGDSTLLTAQNANSYLWSNGAVTPTIYVKPIVSSVYTVTGTFSNCTNSSTLSVVVNPKPIISISGNTNVCTGQSTTLTASGTNSYSWNNGVNGNSIIVSPTTSTIYTVSGTSISGCNSSVITTVNVVRCDGIEEESKEYSLWFPSPTSNVTKKYLYANTLVSVFDYSGQLVSSHNSVASSYFELNFHSQNLAEGIYYVIISYKGNISTQRVIYKHTSN